MTLVEGIKPWLTNQPADFADVGLLCLEAPGQLHDTV